MTPHWKSTLSPSALCCSCCEHICWIRTWDTWSSHEKNEIKTAPENLGHMFSRAVATRDCVLCRCLINACIEDHSSIPKGILNFFPFLQKSYLQLGFFLHPKIFQPTTQIMPICYVPLPGPFHLSATIFFLRLTVNLKPKPESSHLNAGNFKIWLKM